MSYIKRIEEMETNVQNNSQNDFLFGVLNELVDGKRK
jgi:hypothetical protein